MKRSHWIIIGVLATGFMSLIVVVVVFALSGALRSGQSLPESPSQLENMETTPVSVVETLADEDYQALEQAVRSKLEGLDINAVHVLIADQSLAIGQSKQAWRKDDLSTALKPLVVQGVSDWVESVIIGLAQEQDLNLSGSNLRNLRDQNSHEGWHVFITLYEMAFLKEKGVHIIEE